MVQHITKSQQKVIRTWHQKSQKSSKNDITNSSSNRSQHGIKEVEKMITKCHQKCHQKALKIDDNKWSKKMKSNTPPVGGEGAYPTCKGIPCTGLPIQAESFRSFVSLGCLGVLVGDGRPECLFWCFLKGFATLWGLGGSFGRLWES